jgi:hypothetical protein
MFAQQSFLPPLWAVASFLRHKSPPVLGRKPKSYLLIKKGHCNKKAAMSPGVTLDRLMSRCPFFDSLAAGAADAGPRQTFKASFYFSMGAEAGKPPESGGATLLSTGSLVLFASGKEGLIGR